MNRFSDVETFYQQMASLTETLGGFRYLRNCNGKMKWPGRGLYFFFDEGGSRIVRIGTHALKQGSNTTLWNRLSQHKGSVKSGGGNHRGSIFRLLVGAALIRKNEYDDIPSWGLKGDISKAADQLGVERAELKEHELQLEVEVSDYIGNLPFLWLDIDDLSGPESHRGLLERNSIALLSQCREPQSKEHGFEEWLGLYSDRPKVRASLLWNNNHVDENYDPRFLDVLSEAIAAA